MRIATNGGHSMLCPYISCVVLKRGKVTDLSLQNALFYLRDDNFIIYPMTTTLISVAQKFVNGGSSLQTFEGKLCVRQSADTARCVPTILLMDLNKVRLGFNDRDSYVQIGLEFSFINGLFSDQMRECIDGREDVGCDSAEFVG